MIRLVLLFCAAALLATSGIVHRLWTGEWSASNELTQSAARLMDVPKSIGNGEWEGTDTEVDQAQMKRAEAISYLSRRYIRGRTGAEVSIFIICGRPGPVSVHTPDICYGGLGFQMEGSQHQYLVSGDEKMPRSDLTYANFKKADPVVPQRLRIYWTWKNGRGWRAPSNPRMTFGGASSLYKLYLVYRPAPGSELTEQDPCQDFMKDFLPELEKRLSPAS